MGLTIAQKIIKDHIIADGEMPKLNEEGIPLVGEDVALRIDQTLTQDATGTMAYLEFETIGIPRVRTELSVAYIDHNTLQSGFENADDHRFIQSMAAKYGLYFSKPGNGICHQVHLERFGVPGKTLIGSDSHTPTGGGIGMLAMGAGGLDVAVAMGGGAYHINMPKMFKVNLTGALQPFVTAKDVALEILRILTVKGGVGAIIEWGGPGVQSLSVPERATITNMGAELGATTSIFPSDETTKAFLEAQGRGDAYIPLASDEDAVYDKVIDIDLSSLEPLIAMPHSPDNVVKVSELAGGANGAANGAVKVDQVCVGSCTNSSLMDMLKVAAMLKGKTVADSVSMSVSPGSKQVLRQLADSGALSDILASGARVLECACGPCIGMGFSPNSGGVSLRTFNRNFEGRSGTADAGVYLVSPETAVAAALTGYVTDPRFLNDSGGAATSGLETAGGQENAGSQENAGCQVAAGSASVIEINMPEKFTIDDSAIIPPLSEEEAAKVEILRGPNIKEFPIGEPLGNEIEAELVLKVEDNITTDHIMPAGSKILPYRSNIPHLSQYCFGVCDATFPERAKACGKSIVVGGANYGQGSSREHAALVPLYLGVKAVVTKSFARIHVANLVNAGILPLTFENPEDYNKVDQGDMLRIGGLDEGLATGRVVLVDETKGIEIPLVSELTDRQIEILRAGGLLKFVAN